MLSKDYLLPHSINSALESLFLKAFETKSAQRKQHRLEITFREVIIGLTCRR